MSPNQEKSGGSNYLTPEQLETVVALQTVKVAALRGSFEEPDYDNPYDHFLWDHVGLPSLTRPARERPEVYGDYRREHFGVTDEDDMFVVWRHLGQEEYRVVTGSLFSPETQAWHVTEVSHDDAGRTLHLSSQPLEVVPAMDLSEASGFDRLLGSLQLRADNRQRLRNTPQIRLSSHRVGLKLPGRELAPSIGFDEVHAQYRSYGAQLGHLLTSRAVEYLPTVTIPA